MYGSIARRSANPEGKKLSRSEKITDLVTLPAGVVVLLCMIPQLILVIKIAFALYTKVVIRALSIVQLEVIFRFEDLTNAQHHQS
jgi:hypothetical protein